MTVVRPLVKFCSVRVRKCGIYWAREQRFIVEVQEQRSRRLGSGVTNGQNNMKLARLAVFAASLALKSICGASVPVEGFSDKSADYALRVKELNPEDLGVDTVKQWSGYLDYEDSKHFFFWFFESRNDPANDPVILWLNGGPGCSSLTSLFFELGPSRMGADLKPIRNPYSWNNNASVIFLDQPLGVGFSYGNGLVSSTDDSAEDVYLFLELFFQRFPHLAGNDFHLAGESYAGHYIPRIAHEIAVVHEGSSVVNLTSIMIGNGLTDPLGQSDSYKQMACGEGGYPAVLDDSTCDSMEAATAGCQALNKLCYDSELLVPCLATSTFCQLAVINKYSDSGLNSYDIRGPCETAENGNCYNETTYIIEYLNQKSVQEALGSAVKKFEACSSSISIFFFLTGDNSKPFQQYVTELVDRDIPVLIYAGDKDFICNWLGNKAWTDALPWKGHEEYEPLPLKPWTSNESSDNYGEVKSYGSLTFLRVYDAGHMVPHYQPKPSLEMVNRWISGDITLGYST